MKNIVRKCISDIRRRIIPAGYKRTQHGIKPIHWEELSFNDILRNVVRKVAKPQTAYWRLGVKSHAKGTFRELVENPETVDMDELFVVQANDLIVNITFAWEHAIAIVNKDDTGLLVSHRFPTYVFNRNVLPDFFKYVITQKWMQKQLDLISPGGAGRNRVMNKSAFLKIPCCVPPLAEQKRIAEILGCCDRMIALKKELIAEKKKQKKALMQKLLNPDSGFRLPGFTGEWRCRKLGTFCDTFSGGTPERSHSEYFCGEIPWIKSGELNSRFINATEEYISISALENSSAKMVDAHTLLIAMYGATAGAIALTYIKAAINQAVLAIIPDESVNKAFLMYALKNQIDLAISKYTQGGQPNFNAGIIKAFLIKIPSNKEQLAIADILSAADKEIDLLEQDLVQQKQKKKSLMQLLLTGIVRV